MNRTLFAWESPRPAALMRVGLGLVLLWDMLGKWPYVVELYSTAGMPMPVLPGSIFEPPSLSAELAVGLYGLLIFSLLAVVAGFRTRTSLVLAFVLFSWFGLLDFGGTYKKYSVIGQHLLVLLAFTRSNAVWSVDAWLSDQRETLTELSPVWPRTLMKLLVSCIYLGAVVTKIPRPAFGTGDLLTFSLLDIRWGGGWFGMWLSTRPALMMLLSNLTVLFELSAVTLLWVPQTRRQMLAAAFGFHLALGVSLHIGIFSPMMIVALCAFLRESDLRWIRLRTPVRNRKRRPGVVWGWYAGCAVVVSNLVFAMQYGFDYSDVFRGASPAPWRELDETTTASIRKAAESDPAQPVRMKPADYFHRVDIGSRGGFPLVFGNRRVFKKSDFLVAQARVIRNHPAMRLQWILRNSKGEQSITPDTLAVHQTLARRKFRLASDNTPPGEYTLILQAGDEEVARRKFRVVAGE